MVDEKVLFDEMPAPRANDDGGEIVTKLVAAFPVASSKSMV